MSIKSIQIGQAGVSNRTPSWVYIETNDTQATVTAAGYLNGAAHEYINSLQNNMMALVSTKTAPGIGVSPVLYVLQVQVSNGIWSLVSPAVDVPVPFIVPGNIQAGLSGTAGTLGSFPAAATSGELLVAAVTNSAGNFNTTISNAASVGQSQVISIPDSGATTANAIISKSAGTQHITTGSLAIDAGSISSGLAAGGFVGLIEAFPTTTASGFIATQAAVNASGNFGTTISNQTVQAQSTVLTLPDVGAATGNVLAAGAALVSGNFPKASGTSGAIVDSGITASSVSGAVTQLGNLFQVSVTFNTAQMVTAYDTPLTIVANPLSSQVILLLQASVYTASTGHTAYATGTAPIIQYSTGSTNGQHGAGTIATAAGLVAGDITAAASQVRNLFGIATAALTGLSGKGIYFSNATGDYTGGTGTSVTFTLVYQLLTATI